MSISDIRGKIAKGAIWMVLFKFIERGIGLLSTIALARLLAPADFGLVAMAMVIIAVLELMGAFGFDVQLIQKADSKVEHFNTAWTFNVLFALTCALLLFGFAGTAAVFYSEPRLEAVIRVLAVGLLIQGFENIGVVNFRRDMQFNREFKFLLAKKIASVATTIPLAIALHSYWALVAGIVFGKVVSVILSYLIHPFRPKFSLAAAGELFHFSKWLLVNNVINFLNNKSPDFIIGKVAGAQALGVYSIAYEISNLPTTELVAPINRAVFPGYSRMADDLGKLREGFIGVISMITLFALPVGTGIALVADLIVPTLLGDKWLSAVPVIEVLSFYGIIMALQTNISYIYLALGKPRLVTLVAGLQLIILLASLLALTPTHGAIGTAWAFLLTAIVLIPVNQALIASQLKIGIREYVGKLLRPIIATGVMSAFVIALKTQLPVLDGFVEHLLALLAVSASGGIVYVALILLLWRLASYPDGAEQFCLNKIEPTLSKIGFKIGRV